MRLYKFICIIGFFLYIFLLSTFLGYTYIHFKIPNYDNIILEVENIITHHSSFDDILDEVKNLVNESVYLIGAFFRNIDDLKYFFTFVEKSQVSEDEWKFILEKNDQNHPNFLSSSPMQLLQYREPSNTFEVFLLVFKKITFLRFFIWAYNQNDSFQRLVFFFLFFAFFIIIITLLYIALLYRKFRKKIRNPYLNHKIPVSQDRKQDYFHQHYLFSLFVSLSKYMTAKKFVYFEVDSEDNVFVKYEYYEGIHIKYLGRDSQLYRVPLKKEDLKKLYRVQITQDNIIIFPFRNQEVLFGLLCITPCEHYPVEDESLQIIQSIIDKFSIDIDIYTRYKHSIQHMDIQFFTYPFFIFTLRERLLSQVPFAVLIFRVVHLETYSSTSLYLWFQHIVELLQKIQNIPVSSTSYMDNLQNSLLHIPFRLDIHKFAVLFQLSGLDEHGVSFSLDLAKKYSREIFQYGSYVLGKSFLLEGVIVQNPPSNTSLEFFMNYLEGALLDAKKEGSYGNVV